jgi:glycogen operon protein
MLLMGDEMGRTQQGNNNAYCQDNSISWVNWELKPEDHALRTFLQRLMSIRKQHPIFHRRSFFQGREVRGAGIKDILWLKPDGQEMSDEEWNNSFARCLGVYMIGDALEEQDDRGYPIVDDDFLILLNAHHEPIHFVLPGYRANAHWHALMDTSNVFGQPPEGAYLAGTTYPLQGRSLALLAIPKSNGSDEK